MEDIERRLVAVEKEVVRLRRAIREAFRSLYDKGEDERIVGDEKIDPYAFSIRARRSLQRLGVETIGDLADKTEDEIMSLKNTGQTTLNEFAKFLNERGLALRIARPA